MITAENARRDLAPLVQRVVAMLDDQQHGIDVERFFAAECLRDRRAEFDVVLLADFRAEIVGRLLVVEHPHELKRRLMMQPVDRVAMNQSPGDVVGVRPQPIDRIDGGNSRQFTRRVLGGECGRPRSQRGGSSEFEQVTALQRG